MIKTFITGIILGVAAVFTALHFVPAVDLSREISIISISPNGGNSEAFYVNIPADRIMLGAQGQSEPLPAGMLWPEHALMEGTRAEIFKLRNANDAVIGVASRVAIQNESLGDVVEWVLHLPARGSLFVTLDPAADEGRRSGDIRTGTREFEELVGVMSERWVASDSADEGLADGKIELLTTYIAATQAAPDGSVGDEVFE